MKATGAAMAGTALTLNAFPDAAAAVRPGAIRPPWSVAEGGMTTAYRIWTPVWRDETAFRRLLAWMADTGQSVEEVWLFDDQIHVLGRPFDVVRRELPVLRERLADLREAGIGLAGLDIHGTLGHGMHNHLRENDFRKMVGYDGVARNTICVLGEAFLDYVRQYYTLMAETGRNFIYIDDDLRLEPHPTKYPCFCPVCLQEFGRTNDREELVAALNEPENRELRLEWTQLHAENVAAMCSVINEAVEAVDPAIELGVMLVGYSINTYGYDFPLWFEALGATRARPGHGYYTDEAPRKLIGKAFDVGRLVRDLPDQVVHVDYELENWPYVTLNKAVATVANEITSVLMMGCNGIAFNTIYEHAKTFDEYDPLAAGSAEHHPMWDEMIRLTEGLPMRGFWPADHPQLMARREVGEDGWFKKDEAYDIQMPLEIAEMGIPLTVNPAHAVGTLLAGRIAEAFTIDELRKMLAGAVYLDAAALGVLWDRGLGELTGVRAGERLEATFEHITDHPLNGRDAGEGRGGGSGHESAVGLHPLNERVEVLATAVHIASNHDLGNCLTTYENELGGRVSVATYSPWNRLGRACKRRQLNALFDWMAHGRMPVRIGESVRVWPMVRAGSANGHVVLGRLSAAARCRPRRRRHIRFARSYTLRHCDEDQVLRCYIRSSTFRRL